MRRPVAMVTVAVLFLVGVLVGGLATHLYYAQLMRDLPGPGREDARFFVNRLQSELELTPEQKELIDGILRESHVEGQAIHRELIPRVREHIEKTRLRIEEVLTPEQRERFEQLNRRHRRSSEHWFMGQGLGPPPHGPRHGRHMRGPAPPETEPPPEAQPAPEAD